MRLSTVHMYVVRTGELSRTNEPVLALHMPPEAMPANAKRVAVPHWATIAVLSQVGRPSEEWQ